MTDGDRSCDNCRFNKRIEFPSDDTAALFVQGNGYCTNKRSMFYNMDCLYINICGKWQEVEKNE